MISQGYPHVNKVVWHSYPQVLSLYLRFVSLYLIVIHMLSTD